MARIIDNIIALRVIYLLVTPFEQTDAYKLGIIDDKGRNLKKASTSAEKNSTSMLHRLVWNLKRVINLAPGGSTKIGSLAAAYLLVKEGLEQNWSENRLVEEYVSQSQMLNQIRFIEEEILIEQCLAMLDSMDEDAPTNATGSATSTGAPTINKLPKRKSTKPPGRSMIGLTP